MDLHGQRTIGKILLKHTNSACTAINHTTWCGRVPKKQIPSHRKWGPLMHISASAFVLMQPALCCTSKPSPQQAPTTESFTTQQRKLRRQEQILDQRNRGSLLMLRVSEVPGRSESSKAGKAILNQDYSGAWMLGCLGVFSVSEYMWERFRTLRALQQGASNLPLFWSCHTSTPVWLSIKKFQTVNFGRVALAHDPRLLLGQHHSTQTSRAGLNVKSLSSFYCNNRSCGSPPTYLCLHGKVVPHFSHVWDGEPATILFLPESALWLL